MRAADWIQTGARFQTVPPSPRVLVRRGVIVRREDDENAIVRFDGGRDEWTLPVALLRAERLCNEVRQ